MQLWVTSLHFIYTCSTYTKYSWDVTVPLCGSELELVLWLNEEINRAFLRTVMVPQRWLLVLKSRISAPLTARSSYIVLFLHVASCSAFNWTELNFKDKTAQMENACSSKMFEWGWPCKRTHVTPSHSAHSTEQRGSIDSLAAHTIQSNTSQLNRCSDARKYQPGDHSVGSPPTSEASK